GSHGSFSGSASQAQCPLSRTRIHWLRSGDTNRALPPHGAAVRRWACAETGSTPSLGGSGLKHRRHAALENLAGWALVAEVPNDPSGKLCPHVSPSSAIAARASQRNISFSS